MANKSVSSATSVRSNSKAPASSSHPSSASSGRRLPGTSIISGKRTSPVASVIPSNHDYHSKRFSANGFQNPNSESWDDSSSLDQIIDEKSVSGPKTLEPPIERRLESVSSLESEVVSLGNYNTDTELLVKLKEEMADVEVGISMHPVVAFTSQSQRSQSADGMHYSRSLFFDDGERMIDFVLVYMTERKEKTGGKEKKNIRKEFERSLTDEGVVLERVKSNDEGLKFVKLHAPWEVLIRYAEVMKLKMPMKQIETSWRLVFDEEDPYEKSTFTATFQRDKMYLFQIPAKKELFFSPCIRSQIVDFILKRKTFTANATEAGNFGIDRLLQDGVYLACYPLHQGRLNDILSSSSMLFPNEENNNNPNDAEGNQEEDAKSFKISPRLKLVKEWASLKNMFKKQPLDEIRHYFGVKISLYFAWLGFYTSTLALPAVLGVVCFLYGVFTLQFDVSTKEVCDEGGELDKTPMCPLCSVNCGFWRMSDSCQYTRVAYLFDNPATVFFAVFMSLWATVYLELWKRYSARITYRWDLSNFDKYEEFPRPEYLAKLSKGGKKRLNIITKMYEPYIPFWRKQFPLTVLSGAVVLFMVMVALASVLGVIIYRVALRIALSRSPDPAIAENSSLITSVTAAVINLVIIMIFNVIYGRVAYYLTELEMPRSQTDFDNSLTLKMYMFQFVNYYSSIFYIAFFKGKFATNPGDMLDDGSFARKTQEECGTGGCLPELAIQLSIIMVGKQALNGFMEMATPWIKWLLQKWQNRNRVNETGSAPQWESDYLLVPWHSQSLFSEYLEMVLQFGFVTIFVAAFPLAPLFALINNALEIRLDATKILTAFRRPVGQRVQDIGVWYGILDTVGKLAILTNAVIIAFTSDFIPRTLYYSQHRTMAGYIKSTLSTYNISDLTAMYFNRTEIDIMTSKQITVCMYQGERNGPMDPHPYQPNYEYWETLAIRLVFILAFENVITVTKMILCWVIPDIPRTLRQNMRQHAYLTNELIMQQELARAKQEIESSSHSHHE